MTSTTEQTSDTPGRTVELAAEAVIAAYVRAISGRHRHGDQLPQLITADPNEGRD